MEILIANPDKIKSITIAIIILKFKKFFILNYLFFEKIYIKSEHQIKAIIKMMLLFLYIYAQKERENKPIFTINSFKLTEEWENPFLIACW